MRIDSPGVEPEPVPEEAAMIGGRAATWAGSEHAAEDPPFEPTIIRGRE